MIMICVPQVVVTPSIHTNFHDPDTIQTQDFLGRDFPAYLWKKNSMWFQCHPAECHWFACFQRQYAILWNEYPLEDAPKFHAKILMSELWHFLTSSPEIRHQLLISQGTYLSQSFCKTSSSILQWCSCKEIEFLLFPFHCDKLSPIQQMFHFLRTEDI